MNAKHNNCKLNKSENCFDCNPCYFIGQKGAIGPTGATGTTGPIGPTGPSSIMTVAFGAVSLLDAGLLIIDPETPFIVNFNNFMPSENVTYGSDSIAVNIGGTYRITYYFSGQATIAPFAINTGVTINDVDITNLFRTLSLYLDVVSNLTITSYVNLLANDVIKTYILSDDGGRMNMSFQQGISLFVQKISF